MYIYTDTDAPWKMKIKYDGGELTLWDDGEVGIELDDPSGNLIPADVMKRLFLEYAAWLTKETK